MGVAAVSLLVGEAFFGFGPAFSRIDQDFGSLYTAARLAREGQSLDRVYEDDWFRAAAAPWPELGLVTFVPHPPANALLLRPLATLTPRPAKVAWTVVLLSALVAVAIGLQRLTAFGWPLTVLVCLLPATAVSNALAYGQPYPLLLLCFVLSLMAGERRWSVVSGLLLAPVVVLKLYALPFLAWFLLTRRFRAAAGMVGGVVALLALSVLGLGLEVHRAFALEVLPSALRGLVQDPYSPIWGSLTSLSYRLFRFEPDLNPAPLVDSPGVAQALAGGLPIAVLVAALAWTAPSRDPKDLRRPWALLMIASLVASPLTASYHFVLLILPVALLVEEALERGALGRAAFFLAALAFVGSSLPHYGFRFVGGWGSLLAYSRLYVLLALLAVAAAPLLTRVGFGLAAAAGLLSFGLLTRAPAESTDAPLRLSHGYSAQDPIDCGRERGFTAIRGPRMVGETLEGRSVEGTGPALSLHCEAGRVMAGPPRATADEDAAGGMRVEVDRAQGALVLWSSIAGGQVLAHGRFRHPRVRADGRFVLAEAWESGSWDIRAFDLRSGGSSLVAGGASNETGPEWSDDGTSVLFASDRGRGLRSTAIYRVAFRER